MYGCAFDNNNYYYAFLIQTQHFTVPEGNRHQKMKLSQTKSYPMNSQIRKNLGGPLSEVFFANLSDESQNQVSC